MTLVPFQYRADARRGTSSSTIPIAKGWCVNFHIAKPSGESDLSLTAQIIIDERGNIQNRHRFSEMAKNGCRIYSLLQDVKEPLRCIPLMTSGETINVCLLDGFHEQKFRDGMLYTVSVSAAVIFSVEQRARQLEQQLAETTSFPSRSRAASNLTQIYMQKQDADGLGLLLKDPHVGVRGRALDYLIKQTLEHGFYPCSNSDEEAGAKNNEDVSKCREAVAELILNVLKTDSSGANRAKAAHVFRYFGNSEQDLLGKVTPALQKAFREEKSAAHASGMPIVPVAVATTLVKLYVESGDIKGFEELLEDKRPSIREAVLETIIHSVQSAKERSSGQRSLAQPHPLDIPKVVKVAANAVMSVLLADEVSDNRARAALLLGCMGSYLDRTHMKSSSSTTLGGSVSPKQFDSSEGSMYQNMVSCLLRGIKDDSEAVRVPAARSLKNFGNAMPIFKPALEGAFLDHQQDQWPLTTLVAVSEALAHTCLLTNDVERLGSLMKDGRYVIRKTVLAALPALVDSNSSQHDLQNALEVAAYTAMTMLSKDADPENRARAAEVLGKLRAHFDNEEVDGNVEHEIRDVPLGESSGNSASLYRRVLVSLLQGLSDEAETVRLSSVDSLRNFDNATTILKPALQDAFKINEHDLWPLNTLVAVSEALAQIGIKTGDMELLAKLLGDSRSVIRKAVFDALLDLICAESCGDMDASEYAGSYETMDAVAIMFWKAAGLMTEVVRTEAVGDNRVLGVQLLGFMSACDRADYCNDEAMRDQMVECLLDMLKDSDWQVRAAAAQSLGNFVTTLDVVESPLRAATTDTSQCVRGAAMFSLLKLFSQPCPSEVGSPRSPTIAKKVKFGAFGPSFDSPRSPKKAGQIGGLSSFVDNDISPRSPTVATGRGALGFFAQDLICHRGGFVAQDLVHYLILQLEGMLERTKLRWQESNFIAVQMFGIPKVAAEASCAQSVLNRVLTCCRSDMVADDHMRMLNSAMEKDVLIALEMIKEHSAQS